MFQVATASVIGESHIATARPNEDNYFIGKGPANWLTCVVSDGCGSAKNAAIGSKLISELVGGALLRTADRIERQGVGEWIIDNIIAELATCKLQLREIVGNDVRSHHATVVAALISPNGGFLLHIGDGIAVNFSAEIQNDSEIVLKQTTTSEPENGEYANETFYITEPSWIKHTRITPITQPDCLLLCTDGAQDVLFKRDAISPLPFAQILHLISKPNGDYDLIIKSALTTEIARRCSSDDKTVVLVLKDEFLKQLGRSTNIQVLPKPPVKPSTPSKTPGPKKPDIRIQHQPPQTQPISTDSLVLVVINKYRLAIISAVGFLLLFGVLLGVVGTLALVPSSVGGRTILPTDTFSTKENQPVPEKY